MQRPSENAQQSDETAEETAHAPRFWNTRRAWLSCVSPKCLGNLPPIQATPALAHTPIRNGLRWSCCDAGSEAVTSTISPGSGNAERLEADHQADDHVDEQGWNGCQPLSVRFGDDGRVGRPEEPLVHVRLRNRAGRFQSTLAQIVGALGPWPFAVVLVIGRAWWLNRRRRKAVRPDRR
ncbi:hypothetical protein GCM10022267_29940 [Lentzea roselyniae]|uniref:Uncharacterized protein n=1 Tax=Lentzea roselyniae TaxID=531940 RepID=A0ABP7AVD5_9PSEU